MISETIPIIQLISKVLDKISIRIMIAPTFKKDSKQTSDLPKKAMDIILWRKSYKI